MAATAVAVLVVTTVPVVDVLSSGLPVVEAERIAVDRPDLVPGLGGRGLREEYEVDGIEFAGRSTGSRQPGELVVRWQADGGPAVRQEVWVLDSPGEAWWTFRTQNPRPRYEGDHGDLVVKADPPAGMDADDHSYFCGNAGRSRTDDLEDCQVWGYWARYGQYLIYVELFGARFGKEFMDSVVSFFDARMPAAD